MTDKTQIPFMPSTIENIDTAFFEWIDEKMNIYTNTNSGWKKTPVLWLSAERSFQVKNDKKLRDSVGKLILPIITVNRTSIEKNMNFKGAYSATLPGFRQYPGDFRDGVVTVARRIQQDKTRNFANKDFRNSIKGKRGESSEYTGKRANKKIVWEKITMPQPSYVSIVYSIMLRSEYQQQMNTMLQPFLTYTGNINAFSFGKDGHRYEGFIQPSYADSGNRSNMAEDERKFERKIDIKVLGYLMGAGKNDPSPKIETYESQVEVRISKERVIVGDHREWAKDDGKYRE
tara:strand:- start:1576 stop:2439 length:864 start_codon:yes stop_codon:yes gene_type:complete